MWREDVVGGLDVRQDPVGDEEKLGGHGRKEFFPPSPEGVPISIVSVYILYIYSLYYIYI